MLAVGVRRSAQIIYIPLHVIWKNFISLQKISSEHQQACPDYRLNRTMIIEYDQEYLRELYERGKTSDKKHRFQPEVVKGYKRAVDALKTAKRIEDLYPFAGLHFEALTGNKKGLFSIRANGKYRVEFSVRDSDGEQIVSVCRILELSNHYD